MDAEFADRVCGIAFVFAIVGAGFGNSLLFDLALMLGMIYFVAGISLIHDFINTKQISWAGCILIYGAILLVLPLSILIVPLTGLLDTGIDLRKRFNLLRGDNKWK